MYDFQSLVDRHNTGSAKWKLIEDDMGEGNEDVIALSVADMEFRPAPEIVEALVHSAQHDIFGYDCVTEAYIQAVCAWMKQRCHCDIQPEWISVSDGVIPALHTALRAVTHVGDKVIVQQPVYYPFMSAAEHTGVTLLNNELILDQNNRYVMDFEDLERKVQDPRCTALVLCNPHNPVGRVWSVDELRRLGDICIENGVTVLSDEIHADFAYEGHEVTLFAALGERYAQHCIDFTAPTKTFNLAGLLCSNVIIAHPELKKAYDIAAENVGGHAVSHAGLIACQAAYERAGAWLDELKLVLQTNLEHVRKFTEDLPITLIEPEGTYLAWLDFRGLGMTPERLCEFMRKQARVYGDEGSIFGQAGDGFERINLACPTELLDKALNNIRDAIQRNS